MLTALQASKISLTYFDPESQSRSIAFIVLSESSKYDLCDRQHELALDYLAIQFAISDRQKLIDIFCHHQPDLLTSSVQDLVDVYSPIIRALHSAVDLSAGTSDAQAFLHDLIEVSQMSAKSVDKKPPSVEDFVLLLKKHQGSTHRFLHQAIKNSKELRQTYFDYAKHCIMQYQQRGEAQLSADEAGIAAAGDLTKDLQDIFADLSREDQGKVKDELDKYETYLNKLSETSISRMKSVVKNVQEGKSEVTRGPGVFLAKWQSFADETSITPSTPEGPVRHGGDESVIKATMVDVDGSRKGTGQSLDQEHSGDSGSRAPCTSNTLRLLLPGFKEILARIAKES